MTNPIGGKRQLSYRHQWKLEIVEVESPPKGARWSCRVRPDAMARRPGERVNVEVGRYRCVESRTLLVLLLAFHIFILDVTSYNSPPS
jgi:hypothetical protein